MKFRTLGRLLAVLLAFGLIAAACGDDDSSDGGDDTGTEAPDTAADAGDDAGDDAPEPEPEPEVEDVTLRVLVHQNPPMVEFMESFNDQFEAANPHISVDMSVVSPGGPEYCNADTFVR